MLSPLFTSVIEMIQDNFRPVLHINTNQNGLISMTAITRRSIPVIAAAGAKLTAGAHIFHSMVPYVLLFTLLAAWPVSHTRDRWLLMGLAFPLMLLLSALTVPFQLAGSIEIMFQQYAQQYSATRNKPLLLYWMLFMEGGGNWLLPIVMATVGGLAIQNIPHSQCIKRRQKSGIQKRKRHKS